MRLSLVLFAASIFVSVWLTVFSEETRSFFKNDDQIVVIDEDGPENYLTAEDTKKIRNWTQSQIFREFDYSSKDPALFFNTYYISNIGRKDISNGVVQFDNSLSTEGLIAARIRAPLVNHSMGQIDPRRFAWNEFQSESQGKFSFKIPLLKVGETITVQIIADELGAVVPTYRAADIRTLSRIEQTLEAIKSVRWLDWIEAFRILSICLLAGSAFYLGRNFDQLKSLDWKKMLQFLPKAKDCS